MADDEQKRGEHKSKAKVVASRTPYLDEDYDDDDCDSMSTDESSPEPLMAVYPPPHHHHQESQQPPSGSTTSLPFKKRRLIDQHEFDDETNLAPVQILQDDMIKSTPPPLSHHDDHMPDEPQVVDFTPAYVPEVIDCPPPYAPVFVDYDPPPSVPQSVNLPHPHDTSEPGSRELSLDELCLSKRMIQSDLMHGSLLLDTYEVSQLLEDPQILVKPPPPGYERMLLAFDEDNRQYNMLLSVFCSDEDMTAYSIERDWSTFVRSHNLISEDEVLFYRVYDDDVADDFFYVLRFFKKPRYVPFKKVPEVEAGSPKGQYRFKIKHKKDGGMIFNFSKNKKN